MTSAAFRTRSGLCDALSRLGVRSVSSWSAFPSAPALGSTNSATDRSALFAGFIATMAGSDFSRPFIVGYGSSPSRRGPASFVDIGEADRPDMRPPRFRRRLFVRDGVFDRGGASASRIATPHMLPSTSFNGSAPAKFRISQLNNPPRTMAVYASRPPSPTATQHSLPGVRYDLPGPDFHRLDNASFLAHERSDPACDASGARRARCSVTLDCFVARAPRNDGEGRAYPLVSC